MKNVDRYKFLSKEGDIGGKAIQLRFLEDRGFNVPKWIALPAQVMLEQCFRKNITDFKELKVEHGLIDEIEAYFGAEARDKVYAVRSSAIDEDGLEQSFAGQFETFLNVPFSQLAQKIKEVWISVDSERVRAYRKQQGLETILGIGVIIQELVDADVSGVAFGADPLTGRTNQKVINALYGLGEGVVSGELDADMYKIFATSTEQEIAVKGKAYRRNTDGGISLQSVDKEKQEQPCLDSKQIKALTKILDQLNELKQHPQDIEFAIKGSEIYLLQTRPITTLQNIGEYTIWDNSNIIESYPGITTPLTFSFIIKMYEQVYRQFVSLLGVSKKDIEKHAQVFANTLGLVRGRVYYNLLSWYKMLAMVPGYSLNAEFMEEMMGVKERFELKEDLGMNKGLARWRVIKMLFKMIALQIGLKKERKRFYAYVDEKLTFYGDIDYDQLSASEIVAHYQSFERELLLEWKAPLINDFFAMIWFGLLKKMSAKHIPGHPNIHNNLLCGSQDIISVEPIHLTLDIVARIRDDEALLKRFKEMNSHELWDSLEEHPDSDISKSIHHFIQKFGQRCVGELKLETISYNEDPSKYLDVLKQHLKLEQSFSGHYNLDKKLRENAEEAVKKAFINKRLKGRLFRFLTQQARVHISNRENLRFERTKGFGMVRTMFNAFGRKMVELGMINDARDVFYLKLEEIKAYPKGFDQMKMKELIAERKAEFENYASQAPPSERFASYGEGFKEEEIYAIDKLEKALKVMQGIGCCPGRVQAKVQVIEDPSQVESLNGDILVTSSTDPGWVVLFPTASGILVERGSLLSHAAIVSREMGIPCIVGVKGLLRSLKTGDEVVMHGSTGEVILIENG